MHVSVKQHSIANGHELIMLAVMVGEHARVRELNGETHVRNSPTVLATLVFRNVLDAIWARKVF